MLRALNPSVPIKDRQKRLKYHKQYNAHHYAANKDKRRWQVRERRLKIKAWWREYKEGLVCVDCGFEGKDNPWALEHDHLNPEDKSRVISRMVSEGRSIKSILEEVAKCEPVCSNCHRKREYLRHGEGLLNTDGRSRQPSALKDQMRRRNSRKRVKREKIKEEYKGKRRPGPDPDPLPSLDHDSVVKRYKEHDERVD